MPVASVEASCTSNFCRTKFETLPRFAPPGAALLPRAAMQMRVDGTSGQASVAPCGQRRRASGGNVWSAVSRGMSLALSHGTHNDQCTAASPPLSGSVRTERIGKRATAIGKQAPQHAGTVRLVFREMCAHKYEFGREKRAPLDIAALSLRVALNASARAVSSALSAREANGMPARTQK